MNRRILYGNKFNRDRREDAFRRSIDRIKAAQEETRRVVASGSCPLCGGQLRRNLSLTGWWQCEQFGSEAFRKDATKPPCSWQGFTE